MANDRTKLIEGIRHIAAIVAGGVASVFVFLWLVGLFDIPGCVPTKSVFKVSDLDQSRCFILGTNHFADALLAAFCLWLSWKLLRSPTLSFVVALDQKLKLTQRVGRKVYALMLIGSFILFLLMSQLGVFGLTVAVSTVNWWLLPPTQLSGFHLMNFTYHFNDYLGGIVGSAHYQVVPAILATFRLRDAGYRPSLVWLIVAVMPFFGFLNVYYGISVVELQRDLLAMDYMKPAVLLVPSALAALALIPRSRTHGI